MRRKKSDVESEEKALVVASLLGTAMGLSMLYGKNTGYFVAGLGETNTGIAAAALFVVGMVGVYVYLQRRKKSGDVNKSFIKTPKLAAGQ